MPSLLVTRAAARRRKRLMPAATYCSALVVASFACTACDSNPNTPTASDVRIVDYSVGDGLPSAVVLSQGQRVEIVLRAPVPTSFTEPKVADSSILTSTTLPSRAQNKPGFDTIAIAFRPVKPGRTEIAADWVDSNHVLHPKAFTVTVTVNT